LSRGPKKKKGGGGGSVAASEDVYNLLKDTSD